jgi:hypothetical protein
VTRETNGRGRDARNGSDVVGWQDASILSRRTFLGAVAGGAVGALGGERLLGARDPVLASITVYASPTCGCCRKWITYLEGQKFSVTTQLIDDVTPQKRKLGVPEQLWSCHTATVDGYVVEGHVPADVIQRVLKERPKVAGIAAPGMPQGSPGMEGPRSEPYEIVSFTRTGQTAVYARRG